MEQFNSKLYDKYQNLKKRKLIEEEELSHKREDAIKSYQHDVDDLLEELQNENDRLRSEIIALQEKYSESQKLVLEGNQKTKELSNEVGRLQNLLLQKNDDANSVSLRSPYTSPRTRSTNTYKGSSKKKTPNSSSRQSEIQYKEAISIPCENRQQQQHVPECCRNNNTTSSGDAMSEAQLTCAFQTLLEFLVGMKFSLELQADGLCILAIHQRSANAMQRAWENALMRSRFAPWNPCLAWLLDEMLYLSRVQVVLRGGGYTFTLTWLRHEDGGDGEMFYRVSTLGTLERIALDWMKEEIVFRMTMFSVFFDRIKRVLGHS